MSGHQEYDKPYPVRIYSGATAATASLMVAGWQSAVAHIPAGLKGHLRCKGAVSSGGTFAVIKDNVTTIITQTMAAVGKPATAKLRDEFLACHSIRLLMTSAQTANKTIYVFPKGG